MIITPKSRRRTRAKLDPEYESRVQAAIKGLQDGTYKNPRKAALAEEVRHHIG